MDWDLFISHASEDKVDVARPLAGLFTEQGLKVWFDEDTLTVRRQPSTFHRPRACELPFWCGDPQPALL